MGIDVLLGAQSSVREAINLGPWGEILIKLMINVLYKSGEVSIAKERR